LAGALQDYGRALVVGDSSTHGKGTVQSLLQLAPIMRQNGLFTSSNPGALKVTIRKFYRASGASTQLKGVTPDIIIPSVNNHIEVGEASLENPMVWDTIPAANYDKVNRVEPYVAELKKRSDARISTDRDFAYVRDEIARFKKMQAEKSVSLNEEKRLKEKKELDDRSKVWKKDLASRPEPAGKVYDITLKLADEIGLPAPTVRTNQTSSTSTNGTKALAKDNSKEAAKSPKGTTSGKDQVAETKKPAKPPGHSGEDDDADDDALPVDITLDETKRILTDYVALWNNGKGVAVTQPGGKNRPETQP